MIVKQFRDYSKGEQRNLLMHWWYYYSKQSYNLGEFNRFRSAVEKDAQMVMNIVFLAMLNEKGNDDILSMMRTGRFEEYWDQIVEFSGTDSFKDMYAMGEHFLIEEIVNSYNNPKARDGISKEQILSSISRIIRSNGYELTSERVSELYEKCVMTENDFCDGELTGNFTVGEGINASTIFMSDRLNEYREEIFECIEMLPNLNRGNSYLNLFTDKNGVCWTNNQDVLDKLLQLGRAIGLIYFPNSREDWCNLPGGGPIVTANYLQEDCMMMEHKPNEYEKVLDYVIRGTYKNE